MVRSKYDRYVLWGFAGAMVTTMAVTDPKRDALAAEFLISWDANDPAEQVTSYEVRVDVFTLNVPSSSAGPSGRFEVLCSSLGDGTACEPGNHVAGVVAINEFGRSDETTAPFGIPKAPRGFSVSPSGQ